MADPDLQITWVRGGPGHLNPVIRGGVGGGGRSQKGFFRPFRPQFGLKIRRGQFQDTLIPRKGEPTKGFGE